METKIFKINYSGKNFDVDRMANQMLIEATSQREAVIKFWGRYFDWNYFPQDDGSILDCDGQLLARPDDDYIKYDGGYIEATEAKIEKVINPYIEGADGMEYKELLSAVRDELTADYPELPTQLLTDIAEAIIEYDENIIVIDNDDFIIESEFRRLIM